MDLHPKIQAQAEALMDDEGFTEMKELVTFLVKEETKRREERNDGPNAKKLKKRAPAANN